jgi:hypothetical protein
VEVQIAYDTSVGGATRSCGSKRAYQEGAAFVVADELPVDLFRRRLRAAPSQQLRHSTCSGGTRTMVLARHLLNSLVRNIEIRREPLIFPDTNKNANKTDGWSELLLVFSMRREDFSEKSGIEPAA